jgi:D-glucosaminate-specific PTS system IID component
MISSGLMNKVIDAASILGLFMMGALSASYVRLSTKLQYTIEATETVISLQKILDAIIPGILPLLAIFGILWYFKNKGQNYVKLIGLIILICMVGALIGVF